MLLTRHVAARNLARCTSQLFARCMNAAADPVSHVDLNEDQVQMQHLAQEFGREQLLPFAAEWDEKKHFPKDVLKVME